MEWKDKYIAWDMVWRMCELGIITRDELYEIRKSIYGMGR